MFKAKYIYNGISLSYDKISFFVYYKQHLIIGSLVLVLGMVLGSWGSSTVIKNGWNIVAAAGLYIMPSKHDIIMGSNEWKDSVFNDYQVRADLYLKRPEFKNTPIKAEVLTLAAHNAYISSGILLPVELCLAQCQWESGMGMKGRSPVNNPFNIGEYDTGTVLWFDNTFEGTQAYFNFMCNNYLKCKPLGKLFNSFTNCNNKRYASNPEYEKHVTGQYYYIKRWINKELIRKRIK